MQFTLESDEGLPIRGNLSVPTHPRALVIVIHGFKGFKDWGFFPWMAESFCKHHIAVCRFNMSRSGIGENPETFERLDLFADDTYTVQLADLRKVVSYVREHSSLPLFLLGHSRGGGVALLAAREVPMLRGVITWSAIARVDRGWDEPTTAKWRRDGFLEVVNTRTQQTMRVSTRVLDDVEANRERLDILAAAKRLDVPLLAIHGARDESVPLSDLHDIAGAASDASVMSISTASHTYNAIHPLVHVPKELSLAAIVSEHFVTAYA